MKGGAVCGVPESKITSLVAVYVNVEGRDRGAQFSFCRLDMYNRFFFSFK